MIPFAFMSDLHYETEKYMYLTDNDVSSFLIGRNAVNSPFSSNRGVTVQNNRLLILCDNGIIKHSSDGISFTNSFVGREEPICDVYYDGTYYVALSFLANVYRSTDLISWTYMSNYFSVTNGEPIKIAKVGSNYVIVHSSGTISSSNLTTWTNRLTGMSSVVKSIIADGSSVIIGDNGSLRRTTNGTSWTSVASGLPAPGIYKHLLIKAGSTYYRITGGSSGVTAYTSTNGTTWVSAGGFGSGTFYANFATYDGTNLILEGNGVIYKGPDISSMVNYTHTTTLLPNTLNIVTGLAYFLGTYFASALSDCMYSSASGTVFSGNLALGVQPLFKCVYSKDNLVILIYSDRSNNVYILTSNDYGKTFTQKYSGANVAAGSSYPWKIENVGGVLHALNGQRVGKSLDNGQTWTFTNRVTTGSFQRSANNGSAIVAVESGAVRRSVNGGVNWTTVISGTYKDVYYSDGSFYVTNGTTGLKVSVDGGVTFSDMTAGASIGNLCRAGGVWLKNTNTSTNLAYSSDLITWTTITNSSALDGLNVVLYSDAEKFFVLHNNRLYQSNRPTTLISSGLYTYISSITTIGATRIVEKV